MRGAASGKALSGGLLACPLPTPWSHVLRQHARADLATCPRAWLSRAITGAQACRRGGPPTGLASVPSPSGVHRYPPPHHTVSVLFC